jgi:hypothetical protein
LKLPQETKEDFMVRELGEGVLGEMERKKMVALDKNFRGLALLVKATEVSGATENCSQEPAMSYIS